MEALKDVPDEIRLEVYDCIIEYAFSGKIPSLKPMAKMAFNFIKNDIDRASEKYDKTIERNRNNGKKGGRPKKIENQLITKTQENPKNPVGLLETQQNPNEDEYDDEDDNNILLEKESKEEKIKKENFETEFFPETKPVKTEEEKPSKKVAEKKVSKPREKFTAPSVQQVQDYCNKRQNGISGYNFVNFYQSKGWKVGNSPMKDWEAAVRTWEQKNKENEQSNNFNKNNGAGYNSGNTSSGFKASGKKSGSSILAERARREASRNGNGGDFTTETEVVIT